jgi:hypothetical protein
MIELNRREMEKAQRDLARAKRFAIELKNSKTLDPNGTEIVSRNIHPTMTFSLVPVYDIANNDLAEHLEESLPQDFFDGIKTNSQMWTDAEQFVSLCRAWFAERGLTL